MIKIRRSLDVHHQVRHLRKSRRIVKPKIFWRPGDLFFWNIWATRGYHTLPRGAVLYFTLSDLMKIVTLTNIPCAVHFIVRILRDTF